MHDLICCQVAFTGRYNHFGGKITGISDTISSCLRQTENNFDTGKKAEENSSLHDFFFVFYYALPNGVSLQFLICLFETGKSQNHLDLSEEEFRKIVKVNFMAPWYLLNAVARRMRDNKSGGSIVLLTSLVGAERGLHPGSAAYASCSAGLQQLARVYP